jgi:hypothetical protein
MKLVKISMVVAVVCLNMISVMAQGWPSFNPTGVIKGGVSITQKDDQVVVVEARMAAWQMKPMGFTNGGVFIMPKNQVPVVKEIKSILLPVSLNDIPGGQAYIIRMEESADGWFWKTYAQKSNLPVKNYIAVDSNTPACKVSKAETGSMIELQAGVGVLKPGRYAVYIMNNQYIWDFMVE